MTTAGASEPTPPAAPAGPGAAGPDWTDQVADLVVDSVDKVRARTTGPVLNVAHAAVYGIVAAIIALPVVIAVLAGLVKLLNWVVPGDVWIAYLIVAAMMWLGGWVVWSRRERSG
jgi:hypothetical protein